MRVHAICGASIHEIERMALARVYQLEAAYWREFDAELASRATPAVMVEKWPEASRVWVLSPNQPAGKRKRMV